MKKIKLLFIILIIFSMPGCYDYHELNNLAIITAVAIDKKDDKYELSVLIANSKKSQVSSKEGESATIVYSAKGKTISEAVNKINLKISKTIYFGHLSVIVMNEEIAREGIGKISDLILRDPFSIKYFYLMISKDYDSKDIIKILAPLESFPSQNLYSKVGYINEVQSISSSVTYNDFINKVIKKGIEPTVPTITIEGNAKKGSEGKSLQNSEPEGRTSLGPLSIFKSDKLLGFASENESKGINVINNIATTMLLKNKCDDSYFVSRLRDMKRTLNYNYKTNTMAIKVTGNAELREMNCNYDLTKIETINYIEKEINKSLKKIMKQAIIIAQDKYKTDIFGFGEFIYKRNPKYFKERKNWNDFFSNMNVDYKTNINIITKGSLVTTLKEVKDEK